MVGVIKIKQVKGIVLTIEWKLKTINFDQQSYATCVRNLMFIVILSQTFLFFRR